MCVCMCVCVCVYEMVTQLGPTKFIKVFENEVSFSPLYKLIYKIFRRVDFFFEIGLFFSPINFPVKKILST